MHVINFLSKLHLTYLPLIVSILIIMPIISADGYFLSPLYVVLKEITGAFRPRVKETLFRPANVY